MVNENYTSEDEKTTKILFGNKCFGCNTNRKLSIDHHLCLNDGHALTIRNAVLLCQSCNSSKGVKKPEEFYSKNKLQKLNNILKGIIK